MNKILIDIYLFLMMILAKIQIFYNQYVGRNLKHIFENVNTEDDITEKKLEYIYVKDGEEIIKTSDTNYVIEDPYDFVIKKEKCEKDNVFFGQLSDNLDDVLEKKKRIDNRFMSITMVYKGNEYDINLDKPINFNVVGNVILDYAFMKWYMNTYNNIDIKQQDTYELKVMDNNINIHSLNQISYIELKKEKYEIANSPTDSDNSD
tara:strand:- start:3475 stop:4089 length:615 start_codon:yes stop_codon:yes gene_type:complete